MAGVGTLTNHGKLRVAESMYAKGKAFIAAALLLRRAQGSEPGTYVVLQLLCHGIENTLKGLLLRRSYHQYRHRIRSPIGHDLELLVSTATTELGLLPVRGPVAAELHQLNQLYKRHWLRYGSVHDLFVDPKTITYQRVLRWIAAVVRRVEKRP